MFDPKIVLKEIASASLELHKITSYADALTAAIVRAGDLEISSDPYHPNQGPKLTFRRDKDVHDVDYVSSGRHTLVYEMIGTGKKYRVMIEPIQETHK